MIEPQPGRALTDLTLDFLDAERLAAEFRLDDDTRARLSAYHRFIDRHGHALADYPRSLFPLAHAAPADSPVRQAALAAETALPKSARPWFRRLHVDETEANPALLRQINLPSGAHAVATFERDGQPFALAGCGDGRLLLFDLRTGALVRAFLGHTGVVTAVAVSGDGRHALSCSRDKTLRWWDWHTGHCLAVFPFDHPVECAALSHERPYRVACGFGDGSVLFFQLEE